MSPDKTYKSLKHVYRGITYRRKMLNEKREVSCAGVTKHFETKCVKGTSYHKVTHSYCINYTVITED